MAEYIYAERVLSSKRYEDGLVESMVDPYGERREEIVRCRDCVHWRKPSKHERSKCTGVMAFVEPTPEGFCAWGRREES